ncbi:unnamed protein product [Camellia sinensis]
MITVSILYTCSALECLQQMAWIWTDLFDLVAWTLMAWTWTDLCDLCDLVAWTDLCDLVAWTAVAYQGFRRAIFVTMGIVAMLGYTYDWMDFKLTRTSLMGFKLTRTTSLINVLNFGAIGDGIADDSQVHYFIHACPYISLHGDAMQRNHTLLGMECNLWINIERSKYDHTWKQDILGEVWGDIKAPDMMNFGDINSHTWLVFSNVDGLIVSGTGQIDGTGKSWWDSCPT